MSSPVPKISLVLSVIMVISILSMTVIAAPSSGGVHIERLETAIGSVQDNGTEENGIEDRTDGETILVIAFLVAIIGMLAIIYVIIFTDRKK